MNESNQTHLAKAKGSGPADTIRKYNVVCEAESAENLPVATGTEVCFVWKRQGKLTVSECSDVWSEGENQGVVYWDATLTQVCTLTRDQDGPWKPKPCVLQVQSVPVDECGQPMGLGAVVASVPLDLAQFCGHDSSEEPNEPQRLVLDLTPSGKLTVTMCSLWLQHWIPSDADAVSEDGSELSITPAPSTASLPVDESATLTLAHYAGDSSTAASSPDPWMQGGNGGDAHSPPSAQPSFYADQGGGSSGANESFKFEGVRRTLDVGEGEDDDGFDEYGRYGVEEELILATPDEEGEFACQHDTTAENSDGDLNEEAPVGFSTPVFRNTSMTSLDCVISPAVTEASVSELQRRCRRLARERDDALAEKFSEASVAVQRGIEIDNLKRAKDMLLQRLETTERQLMTGMRFGDSVADSPSSTSSGNGGLLGGSGSGADAIVHALVEAKVLLAEKEFAMMEMQGQVRAKEHQVEILTTHLKAAQAAAEERAHAVMQKDHALAELQEKVRALEGQVDSLDGRLAFVSGTRAGVVIDGAAASPPPTGRSILNGGGWMSPFRRGGGGNSARGAADASPQLTPRKSPIIQSNDAFDADSDSCMTSTDGDSYEERQEQLKDEAVTCVRVMAYGEQQEAAASPMAASAR